jgi:hypothetical protein
MTNRVSALEYGEVRSFIDEPKSGIALQVSISHSFMEYLFAEKLAYE